VRWGDPTYDEMMVGYIDYIVKMPDRAAVKVAAEILDSYAGEYEALGRTLTITRSGDNLMVGSRGFPQAPLFAESENRFFFKVVDLQISFVKNEKGEVTELILDQGGRTFRAKRLSKPASATENK
jgi:hypothetical protein